jgi:hypothetical protein
MASLTVVAYRADAGGWTNSSFGLSWASRDYNNTLSLLKIPKRQRGLPRPPDRSVTPLPDFISAGSVLHFRHEVVGMMMRHRVDDLPIKVPRMEVQRHKCEESATDQLNVQGRPPRCRNCDYFARILVTGKQY